VIDTASGAARALRAAAFSLAAVSLALAVNAVAGDGRPALLTLVAAVVVLGCASLVWVGSELGRRGGRATTLTAVVVAQAALHTWFSLASGQGCDVRGLVLTGHQHLALTACQPGASGSAGTVPGSAMAVAHLSAVLLTALLIAYGEQALRGLGSLSLTQLLRLPRPVLSHHLPNRTPVSARPEHLESAAIGVRLRLRGPPLTPRSA
jgi:hypothetical protein